MNNPQFQLGVGEGKAKAFETPPLGQDTPRNVPMSVEKQRTDVSVIFFCYQ
jgi:hypothetical protein